MYVNGSNSVSRTSFCSGSSSTSNSMRHSHISSTTGGTIVQVPYNGHPQPYPSAPPSSYPQSYPPYSNSFYPPPYGYGFMGNNASPRPQFRSQPFNGGSNYKGNNFRSSIGFKGKNYNSG